MRKRKRKLWLNRWDLVLMVPLVVMVCFLVWGLAGAEGLLVSADAAAVEVKPTAPRPELPFFPIGIYHPWYQPMETDALPLIGSQGFTVVECWGGDPEKIKRFLDAAHAQRLKVALSGLAKFEKKKFAGLREELLTFKEHPALLSWYLFDEPSNYQLDPNELCKAYDAIKARDRIHPVLLVDYLGASWAELDTLRQYAKACDLLAVDYYPITNVSSSPLGVWWGVLGSRLAVQDQIPVWAVIQAHLYPPLRLPTPEELRCMTYAALVGGAQGLFYYDFSCQQKAPKLWSAFLQLNAETRRMSSILRTPTLPALHRTQVEGDVCDQVVQTSLRDAGARVYLLAVNGGNKSVSVQFTFRPQDIISQRVRVLGRQEHLLLRQMGKDWLFKDKLPAYGGRLYQLPFDAKGMQPAPPLPLVQSRSTVLRRDDFSKGLSRWALLRGHWHVQKGVLHQTEGLGPNIALTGKSNWNNYRLTVRARALSYHGKFGIVFRYSSPERFAVFQVSAGAVSLNVIRNGRSQTITQQPFSLQGKQWYSLELRVEGNQALAVVEKVQLTSLLPPDVPERGCVGLWCAYSTCEFDDFVVMAGSP